MVEDGCSDNGPSVLRSSRLKTTMDSYTQAQKHRNQAHRALADLIMPKGTAFHA